MAEDYYESKLKDSLKKLASQHGPDAIIPVTVNTVDASNFTCDCVTDDDLEIPKVLFKSITGGVIDVVQQPAVGSRIFIGRIADSDEWLMLKAGAIDVYHIKIGNVEFMMDSNGIILNGGSNDGMVTLSGCVTQLNKLENDVNNLKTVFSTWVPVPNDGGAALKTTATSWYGSPLTDTINADLENPNVKQ